MFKYKDAEAAWRASYCQTLVARPPVGSSVGEC